MRTDNLLLLLAVLAWLVWKQKMALLVGGVLAAIAVAMVFAINRCAGSYGWIVLFRFSFVAGRYPRQASDTLTLREYFTVLLHGAFAICTHISIWLLMGILAWLRRPSNLLLVVGVAALAHFLLYPSPEDRYFIWAYIVAGIALVQSNGKRSGAANLNAPSLA